MLIREIKAKTIISKSNLPDCDYVINPYIGCSHRCIYCYARYMKKFTNHSENWGEFVDVKINAPDLIPKNTTKFNNKIIFLSSVTDPYQPIEEKYKLTRKILEKLVFLKPHLCIQTKSNLVLRDIDLIKKFKKREVGFTITTLNENLKKEIEPYSSSISEKLSALKILNEENIENFIFIGPILPFFTDWKEIINKTKNFVYFYMFENLNLSNIEVWLSIKNWLLKYHKNLLEDYRNNCFSYEYWENLKNEIKNFCEDNEIKYKIYFHFGEKIKNLKIENL